MAFILLPDFNSDSDLSEAEENNDPKSSGNYNAKYHYGRSFGSIVEAKTFVKEEKKWIGRRDKNLQQL